jgi:hypothetical protein
MPPLVMILRRRVVISLTALALCATAVCALGVSSSSASALTGSNLGASSASVSWPKLADTFNWPVLRPAATAGLRAGQMSVAPQVCMASKRYQAYDATYGSAPGRWFQLFVAKGQLCGNPPAAVRVTHVTVDGRSVPVSVWRSGAKRPTLADGYRQGMTLTWKRGATAISIESTHLHLSEVVRIARSLAPVSA